MYQIKAWSETFENAASRKLTSLKWFAMPTELTSHGAITLISMDGLDGWAVFGVFNRLCQWTAGYHGPSLRGKLCRSNGDPLTLPQIAKYIGAELEWLKRCVDVLSSPDVGWIEIIPDSPKKPAQPTVNEPEHEQLYNQAIEFSSPHEKLPIDLTKPIPFGIEGDAIQQCDWTRIEAAFLAAWNSTNGTIASRTKGIHSEAQELFADRCREKRWLSDAEKSLKLFPLKCLTGAMRLDRFLKPETVGSILAGNYSFDPLKPSTSHKPADNSSAVMAANMKATKDADTEREKTREQLRVRREALAKKWGADAGLLTKDDVKALDAEFPQLMLLDLYVDAHKPKAPKSMQSLYVGKLHEAMEMQQERQ